MQNVIRICFIACIVVYILLPSSPFSPSSCPHFHYNRSLLAVTELCNEIPFQKDNFYQNDVLFYIIELCRVSSFSCALCVGNIKMCKAVLKSGTII